MEYCEHGDLRHYLVDEKTLPESQAWEIAWQVLGALTSMHQCGFAHRDLKPAVRCHLILNVISVSTETP